MSTNYKVYCDTEAGWQSAEGTPTEVCPNNAGHTVTAGSLHVYHAPTCEVVLTAGDALDIVATKTYLVAGNYFVAYGGANPDDDNAIWNFKIPKDWVSGGRLVIEMVTAAAAGTDVKFLVDTNVSGDGDDMSAAEETGLSAVATGSATSWYKVVMPAIAMSATNFAAGKTIGLYVHRDASDAADTYTGIAYISSITFEYNY